MTKCYSEYKIRNTCFISFFVTKFFRRTQQLHIDSRIQTKMPKCLEKQEVRIGVKGNRKFDVKFEDELNRFSRSEDMDRGSRGYFSGF